ncbi:uncharacterized protein LOC130662459 isoform X2 [Hydractinia symbiolongicarpus]|uniref:uncharacterized protein LOC130662459 isoform X2 n=1 Tax=Hydractinia symbiolongicarpus TaxID=13093 RepID=UPI00254F2847|nr:uncharacterized protein LOC130662459 isoform X2 [Hydractinia symbiolongicarpus]
MPCHYGMLSWRFYFKGPRKRRLVRGAVPTIFAHKPLAGKRTVIEKLEKKRLVSEALKDAEARERAEALKKAQELEKAEALKKQIEEVKRIEALKQIEAQKKHSCRSKYVQATNKSRSFGTQTKNSTTSYHIESICKTFGIPELKAAIINLIQQHASKKMILSPFLEEGNTTSRTTLGIQSNRMDLEKENDLSLNIKKKKQKDSMVNFTSLLPEGVRNMKELNRDMFTVNTVFPCIKCRSISCEKILSIFRRKLLKRPNFKRIRKGQDGDERSKIILLCPYITSLDEFTTSQKTILDEEGALFTTHEIELTYKDFNLEEILKKVLPEDSEELVSSFETV